MNVMVGLETHALETPLEGRRSFRWPWMEGATGEGALQAEAPPRDECGRTFLLISPWTRVLSVDVAPCWKCGEITGAVVQSAVSSAALPCKSAPNRNRPA